MLPPADLAEEFLHGLVLPALSKLLARGQRNASSKAAYEAWCCERFGVVKQLDWPLAPVTLLADGGEPGEAHWLRADPVHLQVNRDQLILGEASTFDLGQDEADALTATLNGHFGAEELNFAAPHPQRWYLRLPAPVQLHTTSLLEVAGKNIDPLLPTGVDARRFRSIFNEAQMLLFDHLVNENREAEGRATVNSVWFWGGGVMPQVQRPLATRLWAGENIVCSLARAAGLSATPVPENGAAWLTATNKTDDADEHLLVLDRLRMSERYADVAAWRQAMERLEQDWFAPLVDALKNGRIRRLSVQGFGEAQDFRISATRADLWKLWRGVRSLADLTSAY